MTLSGTASFHGNTSYGTISHIWKIVSGISVLGEIYFRTFTYQILFNKAYLAHVTYIPTPQLKSLGHFNYQSVYTKSVFLFTCER